MRLAQISPRLRSSQSVDDAVDDIIEAGLLTQGEVTFLDDGAIGDLQRIAPVLRGAGMG